MGLNTMVINQPLRLPAVGALLIATDLASNPAALLALLGIDTAIFVHPASAVRVEHGWLSATLARCHSTF